MANTRFRFLDNVAIADTAFEAFGKSWNELFENSATALFEEMVDTKKVAAKVKKKIAMRNENLENLLYDFLSELIYIKDVKGVVFGKFRVKIGKPASKKTTKGAHGKARKEVYALEAVCAGEKIDYSKKEFRNDVKAVTMHLFKIEKTGKNLKATVVLDI